MGWQKEIILSSGIVLNYWVLEIMSIKIADASAQCVCLGYVDQAAFLAGKPYVEARTYNIDFSSFDPNGDLAAGVMAMVQAAQG